jgi:tetratricopeptide (TPR) repeat protein
MGRWYGDDDRERRIRAMEVADALYLAGAGDTAALPALATLAIDRSQGLLVRGSAAEYIGQLYVVALGGGAEISPPGPSQTSLEGAKPAAAVPKDASARGLPAMTPELRTRLVNALIGAAADPEPTVRAAAVRSLGYVNDRRALMPIVARLQDETRVVRTIAAEGLLRMGVYTLPGQAADVLMRAQDELAAALTTFPDTVNNHVTLGWLESERGRQDAATRALDTALQLDATYPRAHVYKGLVSARTGQYGEAIRHWETAKKLDPGYPNLDRLIEEARKRTALPRP